jgi:hypothetical protein
VTTSAAATLVHSTAPSANDIAQQQFDRIAAAADMIGVRRVAEASRLRGWV